MIKREAANSITLRSLAFYFMLGIFLFYPVAMWAGLLFPGVQISGKNGFVVAMTFSLLFATLLNLKNWVRLMGGWGSIITLYIIIIAIQMIRVVVYDLPGSSIFVERSLIFFPMFFFAFIPYYSDEAKKKIIIKAFMISLSLQLLWGIIHSIYFPYLVIESVDGGKAAFTFYADDFGGYREAGTLINSNAFGSILVISLFVIFQKISLKPPFWNRIFLVFLAMAFIYGTILSVSRLAQISALLVVAIYAWQNHRKTLILLMPIIVISSMSIILASDIITKFEADNSRSKKNELALNIIMGSPTSVLIGAHTDIIANSVTEEGWTISDNSFMLVGTGFGLPVLLFYLIVIISIINRQKPFNLWSRCYLVFLLGTFFINNAIIWDIWIMYAGAALMILNDNHTIKRQSKQEHITCL